jgi:hypothetical protein
MAIPPLNRDGFLPAGIYDATLDEIRERFGVFQESDRRPRLLTKLVQLLDAMRSTHLFQMLLIDGSFVSAKPAPNDIDLVAVLRSGHSFERELPMSEYAVVSRALLRRRFGFDVIVAEADSAVYRTYVDFFSHVREAPNLKNLLRLRL